MWELSLKELVQLGQPDFPDDASFDDAWPEVERLLRRPVGKLKEQLQRQGYGSKELHDKLKTFKRRRNEMAHEFLLDYALMRQNPEDLGRIISNLATKCATQSGP